MRLKSRHIHILDSDEEQDQYFLNLSRRIVEMVWQRVSVRDVETIIDAEVNDKTDDYYENFFCKEG